MTSQMGDPCGYFGATMRERIIAEIKRIADKSAGRPPGSASFERQTAITEAQWRGKFWAR